jgi:nucleotide sugar dehydrogenase
MMKISIIGLGFVGNAMYESFKIKNNGKYTFYGYDKYKNGGIGTIEECINSDIIFLALPTLFNNEKKEYDKSIIIEVLDQLKNNNYDKFIVIKSTVEPQTTEYLQKNYSKMTFIHNPEFLSARTAFEDFHNQKHIVIGKSKTENNCDILINLYKDFYPDANISLCTTVESESMKIFCNSFYSVKIQFFNELYFLCDKIDANYDTVLDLMLKNNWINPMHTSVPGHDGKFSYGGACFPKDTNALLQFMKKKDSPCKILEACISERNEIRKD